MICGNSQRCDILSSFFCLFSLSIRTVNRCGHDLSVNLLLFTMADKVITTVCANLLHKWLRICVNIKGYVLTVSKPTRPWIYGFHIRPRFIICGSFFNSEILSRVFLYRVLLVNEVLPVLWQHSSLSFVCSFTMENTTVTSQFFFCLISNKLEIQMHHFLWARNLWHKANANALIEFLNCAVLYSSEMGYNRHLYIAVDYCF